MSNRIMAEATNTLLCKKDHRIVELEAKLASNNRISGIALVFSAIATGFLVN